MGSMIDQIRSEWKQLPFMIGKALGGIVAVIGFTTAIVIATRRSDPTFADILPSALFGASGILLFVLSSRLLARRLAGCPSEQPVSDSPMRAGALPWAILLLLAAIVLLIAYLPAHGTDCSPAVAEDRIPRSPSEPACERFMNRDVGAKPSVREKVPADLEKHFLGRGYVVMPEEKH